MRLQKLREQAALKGIDTPPQVEIEIETLEKEIKVLENFLKKFHGKIKYLKKGKMTSIAESCNSVGSQKYCPKKKKCQKKISCWPKC